MNDISILKTEERNEQSTNIDTLSIENILKMINDEDSTVANAVEQVIPKITEAVDTISESLKKGGRIIYVGAGTSGRIGIMDSVECPPTFSTPPELVQAVIAGGDNAFIEAVEGAEDDMELAVIELIKRKLCSLDIVIGITASGRTPFVISALNYAQSIDAKTISLSSNKNSLISDYAKISIEVDTGPEILTGSTRMKAATAHKLILNMITTATMIKNGKVYENLMIDLHASNHKLKERAKNILMTITDITKQDAEKYLEKTKYDVKSALVMIKTGVSFEKANYFIDRADGLVKTAIDLVNRNQPSL